MQISDMQEKRNKRLLISFVVLSVSIILALVLTANESTFEIDKDFYRKVDLSEIDKIVLQSGTEKVELELQGNRWRVNGKYLADRNLVEVLFATLQQAEPKRPAASSIRDSIAQHLRTKGVNIGLFSEGNELENFYAGGNTSKTQAYFLLRDESVPHLVTIPGYRVYVAGIFELPSLQWREKLIFDFNWRNFKNLEARFRTAAGNFDVEMNKGQVILKGQPQPDTAKLNTFLDQLSLLTVDEYVAENKKLDSLSRTEALASFHIRDIGDRDYVLKVYSMERQFFGLINGDQFAILNEERILPLLRPKNFL